MDLLPLCHDDGEQPGLGVHLPPPSDRIADRSRSSTIRPLPSGNYLREHKLTITTEGRPPIFATRQATSTASGPTMNGEEDPASTTIVVSGLTTTIKSLP